MKCNIVRDLLPNYIDELTSETTNEEMEKHLENCAECRSIYEKMRVSVPPEISPEDRDIRFLKKLKTKMMRKSIMAAVFACIVLISFTVFTRSYRIPVKYDPEHMKVEKFQAVVLPNQYGEILWRDIDALGIDFETSKEIMAGKHEVLDLVQTIYDLDFRVSESSNARTINRNGEKVRVVYYCYNQTLWDRLFFDIFNKGYHVKGNNCNYIYGSDYQSTDYKPQKREIYYLPMSNMKRLEKLSDSEFDVQKEDATLVWEGTI